MIKYLVPPPRITEQPKNETIPATRTARFTCVGQGYGTVNVMWLRGMNNKTLPNKSNVTTVVTPDGNITSTLTIPRLRGGDRGRYRCRYGNSEGETFSDFAILTIARKRLY